MDIRRTILWMIFIFSVFMIWSNWQVYNAPPAPAQTGTTAAASAASAPASGAPSIAAEQAAAPGTPGAVSQSTSEKITINTDVYKLTFDTLGAQIVRAELLQHPIAEDRSSPTVLLDNDAIQYTVQSGLVGPANLNKNYPNQNTPFTMTSSETTLSGDSLNVVFSAQADGLQVVRTYTFTKGSYQILVNDR